MPHNPFIDPSPHATIHLIMMRRERGFGGAKVLKPDERDARNYKLYKKFKRQKKQDPSLTLSRFAREITEEGGYTELSRSSVIRVLGVMVSRAHKSAN